MHFGARSDSGSFAASSLWLPAWLLAAFAAIFMTGPMPLYSTRTLSVAWEMWQHGQFLVPHINGAPYSHKVPLLFWLIHAGWAVGGVGDVWPRVLQVLIGAATLLLAARLARVLLRDLPQAAALAPWLLAPLCYAFLFGLQIMYEVLLAACVLAALNALAGRDGDQRPYWGGFALAVGAGLLSKGPVMLLHVASVWLLGPWWQPWAARHRSRWYARGALGLLGGCALLLAWALPAGFAGGEVYRNELFFMQTAGRVVDSFDHARPLWWYLPVLPVLALPWALWPRAWGGLVVVARGLGRLPALRMLACWLLPTLFAFSLVSGKQAYYLLPEFAGGAIALAIGLARMPTLRGFAARVLGPWPLALVAFAASAGLYLLPARVAAGRETSPWLIDVAGGSVAFAAAFGLLGVMLLLAPVTLMAGARRIAVATLAGLVLCQALFAQTLWPRFDLRPAAQRIADLQAAGTPVAHLGTYEGQFHFLGRLNEPLTVLRGDTVMQAWTQAHPAARVIHYVEQPSVEDLRHADLIQPFRSVWLVIERADSYRARQQGQTPPADAGPAALFPPDYAPYRHPAAQSRPAKDGGGV